MAALRIAVLGLLLGAAVASAEILHVSTSGDDEFAPGVSNPCTAYLAPCRTVRHALSVAPSTTELRIEAGTYFANPPGLVVPASVATLSISGGWAPFFAIRSDDPFDTQLAGSDDVPLLRIERAGPLELAIENLTLRHGRAVQPSGPGGYGGALFLHSLNAGFRATLRGLRFSGNVAARQGGAGYAESEGSSSSIVLAITDSVFDGNDALGEPGTVVVASGGALALDARGGRIDLVLDDNEITRNEAGRVGGAIVLEASKAVTAGRLEAVLRRNVIDSNAAGTQTAGAGGGIYVFLGGSSSGSIAFENNVITRNLCQQGAGISANLTEGAALSLSFRNDTVAANDSGGLQLNGLPGAIQAELRNAIAWGNADGDLGGSNASAAVDHSDLGTVGIGISLTDGGGNFSADPRFVSPAAGSFRLRPDSPAASAGICGEWRTGPVPPIQVYERIAPYQDFELDPRLGFGATAGCDVGADEIVLAPIPAGSYALIANGLGPGDDANRIDEPDDYAEDLILIRDLGCGAPDPFDPACSTPGTRTSVSLVAQGRAGSLVKVFDSSTFAMGAGEVEGSLATTGRAVAFVNGGTVGRNVVAERYAEARVTGGVVLGSLLCGDDGRIRLTGGTVYSGLAAFDDCSIEVLGGELRSGELLARDRASITLFGSDFTLDGTPVPYGLLVAGGTLTGTLASGEPIEVVVSRQPDARIELVPESGSRLAAGAALVALALRRRLGAPRRPGSATRLGSGS